METAGCHRDTAVYGPQTAVYAPDARANGWETAVYGPQTAVYAPDARANGWETATCGRDTRAIPQHLQLLANFIFHMPVVGMQLLQFAGVGVNVLVGECSSRRESALTFRMSELTFAATVANPPHDVQHTQRPAVFLQ